MNNIKNDQYKNYKINKFKIYLIKIKINNNDNDNDNN